VGMTPVVFFHPVEHRKELVVEVLAHHYHRVPRALATTLDG
jgi:hypothetical protein